MAVLLLCQCGSDRVDIHVWNGARAQIRCLTCGHDAWLDGFTIADFDPAELWMAALVEQARKRRKRSPSEAARIEQQRQAAGRLRT